MSAWIIRQYRGVRIWAAVRFGWPLNVKWLGAHGQYPDDQHDDTEAFRRAVAMKASKGGIGAGAARGVRRRVHGSLEGAASRGRVP